MTTHNNRPTIRQLEYLVAVAEEASFSRAALRCHVSQPTLSSQIRQLETRIGQTCFERTPRGVLMTPVGAALVEDAKQTIDAVDRLLATAKTEPAPLVGQIRLGSVSTITPYLVPEVLAELQADYPSLELELADGVGEELEARLQEGELDAVLVPLPTGLPGCSELPLAIDPFWLVAPADSPLGDLAEPVEARSLAGSKLILLDDPHCIRGQALEVCELANCAPDSALHATSISALVQLVRRGLGATLLPALALDLERPWLGDLRIKRFAEPVPGRTIGLVWRSGSPREADMQLMGSVLMEHAIAKTGVAAAPATPSDA